MWFVKVYTIRVSKDRDISIIIPPIVGVSPLDWCDFGAKSYIG